MLPERSAAPGRAWAVLLPLLAVLLTAATHARDLDGEFVFDDYMYITGNPAVQAGLADWTRFFTDIETYGSPLTHHYRPLVALSYAADVQLGMGTAGFKLTQLALHLLAVLALYWLVTEAGRHLGRDARWTAFAAAAWFGVAPYNVDAVHYLTARSSVLCGLFCLVSVACFLRMRSRAGAAAWPWYGAHMAALALALLSKETALALPAVLVAADLVLVGPGRPGAVRSGVFWAPYAPYALVLFAFWWWAPNVHHVVGYVRQVFLHSGRLAAAVYCLGENLRLMALPTGLSIAHPVKPDMTFTEPRTVASAVAVCAVLWGAWRARKRMPLAAFGVAWYFLLIAPSTFVHLNVILQEHRGYPASAGFGMVLGVLVAWLWAAVRPRRRAVAAAGLAAVALLNVGLALHRQAAWRDELALWTEALKVYPDSWRAYARIGTYYELHGRLAEAERAKLRSIALSPTSLGPLLSLARIYEKTGRVEQAERAFLRVREVFPRDREALGALLLFYVRTGQLAKLVPVYEDALRILPDEAGQTHLALSDVYRRLGDPAAAADHARQALALRPDWAAPAAALGALARDGGRPEEAASWFERAADLAPDVAAYRRALGEARLDAGQADRAVAALRRAVDMDPSDDKARDLLDRARKAAGTSEAGP